MGARCARRNSLRRSVSAEYLEPIRTTSPIGARDHSHAPANEYPKQELTQFRIGLNEVSQANRIEFHNFCRIDGPSTHQAGAAREHIEFARKVTGLMQAHVNLPLGGRKHSLDSPLQDHVEMTPDRSLIEEDLSRGNASAHAHLRKPDNLLVVELGIKLVGQFVRELRFVHQDHPVPPCEGPSKFSREYSRCSAPSATRHPGTQARC